MDKVVVLSVQDAGIVIVASLALVGIVTGAAAFVVAFVVAFIVA